LLADTLPALIAMAQASSPSNRDRQVGAFRIHDVALWVTNVTRRAKTAEIRMSRKSSSRNRPEGGVTSRETPGDD
jgi:hypothetical protein